MVKAVGISGWTTYSAPAPRLDWPTVATTAGGSTTVITMKTFLSSAMKTPAGDVSFTYYFFLRSAQILDI